MKFIPTLGVPPAPFIFALWPTLNVLALPTPDIRSTTSNDDQLISTSQLPSLHAIRRGLSATSEMAATPTDVNQTVITPEPSMGMITGCIILSLGVVMLLALLAFFIRIRRPKYFMPKPVCGRSYSSTYFSKNISRERGFKSESQNSVVYPDSSMHVDSIHQIEPASPNKTESWRIYASPTSSHHDHQEMVAIDLLHRASTPTESAYPSSYRSISQTTSSATTIIPLRTVSPLPTTSLSGTSPTSAPNTRPASLADVFSVTLTPPPRAKQRPRSPTPAEDSQQYSIHEISSTSLSTRSRQGRDPIPSFASDDMDGLYMIPLSMTRDSNGSVPEMMDLPNHFREVDL
ncbi:hypothetical protein BC936DRAFT_138095 [Jimgerdemannia flammicorona]|uniref:Uncharacterized protein n=1 Tax=Jimgerdemannia flammicorona TaxID=994334 RepID=A0A433CW60_9FUNG|nr:hypothetical protein BC936DRAFT_138095 [Jimgerdemannia flammicorona]